MTGLLVSAKLNFTVHTIPLLLPIIAWQGFNTITIEPF